MGCWLHDVTPRGDDDQHAPGAGAGRLRLRFGRRAIVGAWACALGAVALALVAMWVVALLVYPDRALETEGGAWRLSHSQHAAWNWAGGDPGPGYYFACPPAWLRGSSHAQLRGWGRNGIAVDVDRVWMVIIVRRWDKPGAVDFPATPSPTRGMYPMTGDPNLSGRGAKVTVRWADVGPFSLARVTHTLFLPAAFASYYLFRAPIVLLVVLFAAMPALLVVRAIAKRHRCARRRRRGLCLSCGYDLRGNISGRCPECGAIAKAAAAATSGLSAGVRRVL
jgi:hypothetical protein